MKVITIPVTAFAQNCRIVICLVTKKAMIVDPGGDAEKIIAQLNELNLTVSFILLTHGHLDHVGAAKVLSEHYKVEIVGPHQDELFWFDALPMQAQMFGFKAITPFYPDAWLQAGERVKLGELQFEVRHCPGHTPGHVVFYEANHNAVLVGDVIFKGSVGRTDFPKGNATQLLASIQSQILTLPDETVIYSGHGTDTTVCHERSTNPFISGRFG